MKRILLVNIFIFGMFTLLAQNNAFGNLPEVYVDISLKNKIEIQNLAESFSIDRVFYNSEKQNYEVRLWLSWQDYDRFLNLQIPYLCHQTTEKPVISMQSSASALLNNWNAYPTYEAYQDLMYYFSTTYSDICEIDTILSATPHLHRILVAHIAPKDATVNSRPAVWLSGAMHGDEVFSFYQMLRLIHYILENKNDAKISKILQEVDLWISPLENPDGTYFSGDHIVGNSPISTRANAAGIDLNRSYPVVFQNSGNGSYEPEIEAMLEFSSQHPFTLSANFHGGAELFNYPWDSYIMNQKRHPDTDWWIETGRRFALSCQSQNSDYFTDLGGLTNGGNWYIVKGSRQDFMNYFRLCREATLESSSDKVVASDRLTDYWNYSKNALIQYILEATKGLHGKITDSLTHRPLKAKIFIQNYDDNLQHSYIYSDSVSACYHRPLAQGTYTITYSAENYESVQKTITIFNDQPTIQNIALLPEYKEIRINKNSFLQFYPNPVKDVLFIMNNEQLIMNNNVEIVDLAGRILISQSSQLSQINVSHLSAGVYFVKIGNFTGKFVKE